MRPQALSGAALFSLLILCAVGGCQGRPLPEACLEKPDSGRCRAAHPRYFFDEATGQCKEFIWGGCDGNAPFETMEECRQSCMEPAVNEASPELRRSY